MLVLGVLLAALLVCRGAGALGVDALASWPAATRWALPGVRPYAGSALIVFFIAVFPANVQAARAAVTVGGRPATALWLRALMQLLFIALTWWAALGSA
jgi:uncharacterized membrane protein